MKVRWFDECRKMRHRVKILENPAGKVNENGFAVKDWSVITTVWASVKGLSSREYFSAAAVQKENMIKIKIRYRKDIDQSNRLEFRGKQYDIESIDNINFENRFLEIMALEV
jgi:SPP1 family predicted phage head-tail adaptor